MLEDLALPKRADKVCRVDILAKGMSEHDDQIFRAACDNPEWPINTLSNELNRRGISISGPTIRRHRDRVCACGDA